MDVILRVDSTYFEQETSKYRLAMSEITLIESLKRQSDKAFTIVYDISAMDPCYSRRVEMFKSVGVQVLQEHQYFAGRCVEIIVNDDVFLHQDLVKVVREVPQRKVNTTLQAPNGFIFNDGVLSVWGSHPDIVEIVQYVESDRHIREDVLLTRTNVWIYTKHQHNSRILFDRIPRTNGTRLTWPGWQQSVVERYSSMKMLTGTAKGCDLHPTRSSSVVYAKGSARNKRNRR